MIRSILLSICILLIGCSSVQVDKNYFYTIQLSSEYKILGKQKSYGHLKPQPPNGHFRYWVYNRKGFMIYKGTFSHNHICLPEEENHIELNQSIYIRVPAETKKIRVLTHSLEEITIINL